MATIRAVARAHGTAYAVLFRHEGKQTSKTFAERPAAVRFERMVTRLGPDEATRILAAQTQAPVLAPTLAEWLETHLATVTGITDGTKGEYRRLANRTWVPTLGVLPVDAITKAAVARWVNAEAQKKTRRGSPMSAKTLRNAHALLSSVLGSAIEAGYMSANPCHKVRLPRGHQEEMTFLTKQEYARLLAQIPDRWKTLVQFFASTGMRWSEVAALHWGEVDLELEVPVVRVEWAYKRGERGSRSIDVPKTLRSRRVIDLNPEIAAELAAMRPAGAGARDLVFTAERGGPLHHQHWHPRVWRPAVSRFAGDTVAENGVVVALGPGKHPRVHDLRHSHASWLMAAGEKNIVIQYRLGHESLVTTSKVYGHLAADYHGNASSTVGAITAAARAYADAQRASVTSA